MREVYFDNGSTSFPKAPGVAAAMHDYIVNAGINAGRGGYRSSYALEEQIFEAREQLKNFFGFSKESNVIFAPNVTYGLNYVIHGLLKKGEGLMITSMEHNAVARPAEAARRRGVDLIISPCDKNGQLDLESFERLITPNVKAVVMLHGSNVCGSVMPIAEVSKICRERDVFFILDVAQTAGIFPICMDELNIDGVAFTGHKSMLGPQGIGGLLINDELAESIYPTIHGGTGSRSDSIFMPEFMPDKFEPGTLNIPGILGLSAAVKYVEKVGIDSIRRKEQGLTAAFMNAFKDSGEVKIIGPKADEQRCPIVSVDFSGRDNAEISFLLDDEYGIMTRCGLHCAPMAHRTLGTFPKGTVRFSFGHKNTTEEVLYAIDAIKKILK
ncbi:MAG TPA: aminotransferase class V-fold PLP-dependent enzyme [Anaerovoracaceae bacterium]|nr:aminotransferase class V-fold PLP-dependent enzyme [Anaerovoracaceae bacterium]